MKFYIRFIKIIERDEVHTPNKLYTPNKPFQLSFAQIDFTVGSLDLKVNATTV